jgi:hypothetical protein
VERAGARRSAGGGGGGGIERRATPARRAAGLGTVWSAVGGRVSMGSALYTEQSRSEPSDRRSTTTNSWAIWAELGLPEYRFSFSFFLFLPPL